MKNYILYIGLTIFICFKTEAVNGQTTLETLVIKKELWQKTGIDSYSFTQKIFCYCSPDYVLPRRVTVENGEVTLVDGEKFDRSKHPDYLSVLKSFDYIETKINKGVAEAKIEYDSIYGFPTYIYFDIDARIADEETTYKFTDFSISKNK